MFLTKTNKANLWIYPLILLPVILGGSIYLLFRVDSLLMFQWLDFFDLKESILRLREEIKIQLPAWIIFSLPDGLWLFSYVSLMLMLWSNKPSWQSFFWIAIMPCIAIISELLQYFKMLAGTFDIMDIYAYVLGFLLAIIFIKSRINYEQAT